MASHDEDSEPGRYASPPCLMHELDPSMREFGTHDPQAALDVARWRKAERTRLIDERLAIPADQRAEIAERIAARLDAIVPDLSGKTVGMYWPFRGEPDLRSWMRQVVARGGRVALPVVVEKTRPLVFRTWSPGENLVKGVWNIPVPSGGTEVLPEVVISPLVGFDGDGYRLGYGGGFYDRTLAEISDKPHVIGVGYEIGRLKTIYPQWHDVPMDEIVAEK